MKYSLATLAIAAAAVASPVPAPQSSGDAPPAFSILSASYGGTGCPQGTLNLQWKDNGFLPIDLPRDFFVAVGSKADLVDQRKFCQIVFDLSYSPGFSFAVYKADYTGYATLDSGLTGTVKSTYYFSGDVDSTTSSDITLAGPTSGKFVKADDTPVLIWSPCTGGDVLFNAKIEANITPAGTKANGSIAVTKETGKFTSDVFFQWKKC